MALSRIRVGVNNGGKEEVYYLRNFDHNMSEDDITDPNEIPPGVVVQLTWTRNPEEARKIQQSHGQDFINRLPKSANRKYSLADV